MANVNILWIVGLSGVGKTTLAHNLSAKLRGDGLCILVIDGDDIRAAMGNDLGYTIGDRQKQIVRLTGLAAAFAPQSDLTIITSVQFSPERLEFLKNTSGSCFVVSMEADLQLLQLRDTKGLYTKIREGSIRGVVGVDQEWHRPSKPDLVLECRLGQSASELASLVIQSVGLGVSRWERPQNEN